MTRALSARGYGLTLGVHSRLEAFARDIMHAVPAGNVYVNRTVIGAVVGVQPFGGEGLSGTGPKAGGPLALTRFASERAGSINITPQGGDPAFPTGEQVFADYPGIETASAGLAPDAEEVLTPEHFDEVDIIFVMEKGHRAKLNRQFKKHIGKARIVCLDIPDEFEFMQPELISLLKARVTPHLR
eukprot:gene16270-20600_t